MSGLDSIDNLNQLNEQKNDKKTLITFAKLNKFFLIPFICPISCMLTNYFFDYLQKYNVMKTIFIKFIFIDLSYIIGGFLYFVSYFKQKKARTNEINKQMNEEKSTKNIEYIYNEKRIKINTKKIFLIILLISSLFIVYRLINYLCIHNNPDHHIFEIRIYYIFFIPLFSKYILKENIYKHQYLSLIFSILGIILLIIPVCLDFEKDDILPNILNLIIGGFYPLNLVLIKYLYEIYFYI